MQKRHVDYMGSESHDGDDGMTAGKRVSRCTVAVYRLPGCIRMWFGCC